MASARFESGRLDQVVEKLAFVDRNAGFFLHLRVDGGEVEPSTAVRLALLDDDDVGSRLGGVHESRHARHARSHDDNVDFDGFGNGVIRESFGRRFP